MSEDAQAEKAGAPPEPVAPAKTLPAGAPLFLGVVFALQILVIVAASVSGFQFSQDIREARRAAAQSALRAHAYAKYAECVAEASAAPEENARKAAMAVCVKPDAD